MIRRSRLRAPSAAELRSSLTRAFAICLLLAGCSVSPAPRTWLDSATAATLTAQSAPLVLARDEQMRAVNVRDYAQLGAIEVNRMGERELYLAIVFWSTIDRPQNEHEQLAAAFARVDIQADDRTIGLARAQGSPHPPGIGTRPFPHPAPGAQDAYFPIDRSELQAIARSRHLSLTTRGHARDSIRYAEWRGDREGLERFLAALPR